MSMQCNRCRFWREEPANRDPADPDFSFGDCRRRSPVLVGTIAAAIMPRPLFTQQTDPEMDTVQRQIASPFPATFAIDWCGEYEGKGLTI